MTKVHESEMYQVQDMLCFDVYAANQAFGQLYKRLLEPLEITYPQYLVLVTLWEMDNQTVGEIGQQIGLESSTLTPMIKRLESKGLLNRKRDGEDERRVIVSLTAKGQALQEKAGSIPECVENATGLSQQEISTLQSLLKRTRNTISKKD